jgi:hypothetical protein
MNLEETYLVTKTGNKRLGKTKIGFGNLVDPITCLMPYLTHRTSKHRSFNKFSYNLI